MSGGSFTIGNLLQFPELWGEHERSHPSDILLGTLSPCSRRSGRNVHHVPAYRLRMLLYQQRIRLYEIQLGLLLVEFRKLLTQEDCIPRHEAQTSYNRERAQIPCFWLSHCTYCLSVRDTLTERVEVGIIRLVYFGLHPSILPTRYYDLRDLIHSCEYPNKYH